jgi:hypothetical protein
LFERFEDFFHLFESFSQVGDDFFNFLNGFVNRRAVLASLRGTITVIAFARLVSGRRKGQARGRGRRNNFGGGNFLADLRLRRCGRFGVFRGFLAGYRLLGDVRCDR